MLYTEDSSMHHYIRQAFTNWVTISIKSTNDYLVEAFQQIFHQVEVLLV